MRYSTASLHTGLHVPVLHDGSPVGVGVSVLDLSAQGVHIHITDGPIVADSVLVSGLQVRRAGSAGDSPRPSVTSTRVGRDTTSRVQQQGRDQ